MKDNLLNIGSIVEVEHSGETDAYIIMGQRVINHETMKAWDYISIPYEEGFKRRIVFTTETIKNNENVICKNKRLETENNYFYFNHYEIDKILHRCSYSVKSEEQDE